MCEDVIPVMIHGKLLTRSARRPFLRERHCAEPLIDTDIRLAILAIGSPFARLTSAFGLQPAAISQ